MQPTRIIEDTFCYGSTWITDKPTLNGPSYKYSYSILERDPDLSNHLRSLVSGMLELESHPPIPQGPGTLLLGN